MLGIYERSLIEVGWVYYYLLDLIIGYLLEIEMVSIIIILDVLVDGEIWIMCLFGYLILEVFEIFN